MYIFIFIFWSVVFTRKKKYTFQLFKPFSWIIVVKRSASGWTSNAIMRGDPQGKISNICAIYLHANSFEKRIGECVPLKMGEFDQYIYVLNRMFKHVTYSFEHIQYSTIYMSAGFGLFKARVKFYVLYSVQIASSLYASTFSAIANIFHYWFGSNRTFSPHKVASWTIFLESTFFPFAICLWESNALWNSWTSLVWVWLCARKSRKQRTLIYIYRCKMCN